MASPHRLLSQVGIKEHFSASSYRGLVPSREQPGEQPPPLTRICLGGREYSLEPV